VNRNIKAVRAAVEYVATVRACIQSEYRCRKAPPREGEVTGEELLHMLPTHGLSTALRIPPEKTGMLHRARDLRSNFLGPFNETVTWE